ncbi:hypothetical protein [Streptomyces sp. CS62]|uniref:hypothetical protein n=1 Tax=Streptomyces sp. CS62 TaxID=3119268 RepID=UPI002F92B397
MRSACPRAAARSKTNHSLHASQTSQGVALFAEWLISRSKARAWAFSSLPRARAMRAGVRKTLRQ